MQIYWLNPPLSTKTIHPDLGWMNMNTACKEYDWIQPIINWSEYKTLNDIVDHIISNKTEVLCVSSYIWNHVLLKDVCTLIKSIDSNIKIIRGGPQLEKELTFDWYDYACSSNGHGEEFIVEALNQIDKYGKIKYPSEVPWLITKDHVATPSKDKYVYPNESVLEYNSTYILECISVAKSKNIRCGIQYETTRGCPYSCTYCEWGAGGTSAKLSEKPLDIIVKDIELISLFQIHDLEIIDANFGILNRDIDIANSIGAMKAQYGYPKSVMLYGLTKSKVSKKEKILDALFEHNLMNYYFMSVQSSSKDALQNVKRTDITLEENINLAKKYRTKYNAIVKVELILGLPGSTLQDFYFEMDLIQQTNGWDWPRAPFTILPQTAAANTLYQKLHKIKTVKVGITENEEQEMTYISCDSVLNNYKSYQDIVISTYSYDVNEWKEMFFMNKAQKIIGPLIPSNQKASVIMKNVFDEIQHKAWYKFFDDDMQRLINGDKSDEDFMLISGKTVEDYLINYVEEIRLMVNAHTRA